MKNIKKTGVAYRGETPQPVESTLTQRLGDFMGYENKIMELAETFLRLILPV